MTPTLITPPAAEPLTVAELKAWSRIDHDAEDSLLAGLISAARDYVERHVEVKLITQTWRLSDRAFPVFSTAMELDLRPVQSVTEIAYTDADGVAQTVDLSAVTMVADEWSTLVYPAADWPVTNGAADNVKIVAVAGYGDAAAVASRVPGLRHAISLIAAHWYENREESTPLQTRQIPMGAERLMALHRVPQVRFA